MQPGFAKTGWRDITAPVSWQTGMPFEQPIYTNITMSFDELPTAVPRADNPTGSYRKTFTVPASWAGRRIVLHFGGVESCAFVYVNGIEVGLIKDSRFPSEFDITTQARPGWENLARTPGAALV